jgi:hypothetical protein
MRGPEPKYLIELTTAEEQSLRKLANSRTAPHVKVIRARLLMAVYDHPEWSNQQMAEGAGYRRWNARKWCRCWTET